MNDDDYVTYLAKEARSAVSALHEFRLLYSDQEEQIHIFLEGDDDALFYLPHVRPRLAGRNPHLYFCGGKWEVVNARDFLEVDGDTTACLFFIDRDYDDLFGKQPAAHRRTYLTDFYSIENYLVSKESLEVVLMEFSRISKTEPIYEKLMLEWPSRFSQFSRSIKPVLAWALAMRTASKAVNFNNVDLNKVFNLVEGRWKRKRDGFSNFVKAVCRSEEAISPFAAREWLKVLQSGDEKRWLRGKYELWFFETFLLTELKKFKVSSKRRCIPAALEQHRLFDVLGGRISPPESLIVFLDSQLRRVKQ